jgi:hypothetical protein
MPAEVPFECHSPRPLAGLSWDFPQRRGAQSVSGLGKRSIRLSRISSSSRVTHLTSLVCCRAAGPAIREHRQQSTRCSELAFWRLRSTDGGAI